MSHSIYTTEGIVLSSFGIGEADKFFRIFTREFGLIEATAQGVRKITSKNRYGLQDFSISDFSLVRGRDVWRITNISSKENIYFDFKEKGRDFNSLNQIFSLIKRFVQGEEKNEELFDLFFEAINFLKENELKDNSLRNFNLIVSIKFLNNLGYFDKQSQKDIFSKFFKQKINNDLITEMEKIKTQAEKIVREIMEESHL